MKKKKQGTACMIKIVNFIYSPLLENIVMHRLIHNMSNSWGFLYVPVNWESGCGFVKEVFCFYKRFYFLWKFNRLFVTVDGYSFELFRPLFKPNVFLVEIHKKNCKLFFVLFIPSYHKSGMDGYWKLNHYSSLWIFV